MKNLLSILLLTCLVGTLSAVPKRDHNNYAKNPMKVVCYVGTWSVYHKVDPFDIEDIDPHKCTHLMYGFAKIDEYKYTIQVFDPYNDDSANPWDKRGYERFNNLRKVNPELTTFISLGGWYEGSEKYSDMARSPKYRTMFVESVLEFLAKYDFDGLDLDWEYPGSRLGDPTVDKDNYLLLVRELRAAFDPHGYLLTVAVSPGKDKIDRAYHLPQLNELFDFINIMTYDYHGGWEEVYGHNAPLYKRPDEPNEDMYTWFTVNYTMHYYLEGGLTKDKIVMGLPFYGRAWSMMDPNKHALRDEAKGKSPAGFITGEESVLGHNELCQMMQNKSQTWVTHYDEYYEAPYAYNGEVWVGYDDLKSLSCKLAYLKELGVSGAMVWSLEYDDFIPRCGNVKNPLLTKVWDMTNGNEKASRECLLKAKPTPTPEPTTPTPEPTTPTPVPTTPTPEPTTPTPVPTTPTPEPTTPTPEPTTPTPEPTTPTPVPTTPTPEPTTPTPAPTPEPTTAAPTQAPTTQPPPTQPPATEGPVVTVTDPDDRQTISVVCTKQGSIPHPFNIHKYLVCSYLATPDHTGWWVTVMKCGEGTRWHDGIKNCIFG